MCINEPRRKRRRPCQVSTCDSQFRDFARNRLEGLHQGGSVARHVGFRRTRGELASRARVCWHRVDGRRDRVDVMLARWTVSQRSRLIVFVRCGPGRRRRAPSRRRAQRRRGRSIVTRWASAHMSSPSVVGRDICWSAGSLREAAVGLVGRQHGSPNRLSGCSVATLQDACGRGDPTQPPQLMPSSANSGSVRCSAKFSECTGDTRRYRPRPRLDWPCQR